MANFCHYVAVYNDGSTEEGDIRLWYLGGVKDEKGHAKLHQLKQDTQIGKIISLHLDYES